MARRTGVPGYPGDSAQRWPAVHALDAAVLFWLVLEKAPAGTARHALSDQGDAVRDIATVIGRRLGLPVEARPQKTAPASPAIADEVARLALAADAAAAPLTAAESANLHGVVNSLVTPRASAASAIRRISGCVADYPPQSAWGSTIHARYPL